MSDDELPPAETLRKKRADRRARRRAMLGRAMRMAKMLDFTPALTAHWVCRAADNLRKCSCWLCAPYRKLRQLDRGGRLAALREGDEEE